MPRTRRLQGRAPANSMYFGSAEVLPQRNILTSNERCKVGSSSISHPVAWFRKTGVGRNLSRPHVPPYHPLGCPHTNERRIIEDNAFRKRMRTPHPRTILCHLQQLRCYLPPNKVSSRAAHDSQLLVYLGRTEETSRILDSLHQIQRCLCR